MILQIIMKRKRLVIIVLICLFFSAICIHNYCFFYIIPDTSTIDLSITFKEGGYDYPSDIIKIKTTRGYYQYPLFTIDESDNCQYTLVRNGIIPYEINDTDYLKKHKMDLVVFQRGTTHIEVYNSFVLYKDGQAIDYIICTPISESFSRRASTSEFWFITRYWINCLFG